MRTDAQLAIVLERDQPLVEQYVDLRREKQAVRAVQLLNIVAPRPRLDLTRSQQPAVRDASEQTPWLDQLNAGPKQTLPDALAAVLKSLLGGQVEAIVADALVASDGVADAEERRIRDDASIKETERIQLVKARVGHPVRLQRGEHKFAAAKALLDLKPVPGSIVKLDDLALPFALQVCQHLRLEDKQANLVLSCRSCNLGLAGKSHRLPTQRLLERLHARIEDLIISHHPLRETLIAQTGGDEVQRRGFLRDMHGWAWATLIQQWEPE